MASGLGRRWRQGSRNSGGIGRGTGGLEQYQQGEVPAGLLVGGGEGVFELLVGILCLLCQLLQQIPDRNHKLLWQLNNDMFKLGVGVGDA
jgi:hypothetical protein